MDAKLYGKKVVGTEKDPETQGITAFNLSDGTTVDYAQAIRAISEGYSEGLLISNNAYGDYIKTFPDGEEDNNLENMK